MSSRKALKEHPGVVPDIRVDKNGIAFHMDIMGLRHRSRLIIRCDDNGDVWASIPKARSRRSKESEVQ